MLWFQRAVVFILALLCVSQLVTFPLVAVPLAIGLAVYIAILLWRFEYCLLVLPTILPVLDLAPWTGRIFIDEFDFFVFTTIAIWYWRIPPDLAATVNSARKYPLATCVVFALSLSYLVALAIAWLQVPPLLDKDSCHLYSYCGSLRSLKGFLAALLLLPALCSFFGQTHGQSQKNFVLFAVGLLAGLWAESLAIVYERIVFSGLWNFDLPFRAIGTFSSLHTGGQHLDAYLALTTPFVVILLAWRSRSRVLNTGLAIFGLLFLALVLYAALVTFSRGLIAAILVSAFILVAGAPWVIGKSKSLLRRTALTGVALVMIGAMIFSLAAEGEFIFYRFGIVSQDVKLRTAHWAKGLSLMSPGLVHQTFGSGLGSYPVAHARLEDRRARPAKSELLSQAGDARIHLSGGKRIYFEQRVDVQANTPYELVLDLESDRRRHVIALLCEKSLRYSMRCAGTDMPLRSHKLAKRVVRTLNSKQVGVAHGRRLGDIARRPVTLALFVPGPTDEVALDNIMLIAPDGRNLIRNGDFNSGTDHWFFTADDANPWHIANLWLHLYFEQGLLGVLVFSALLFVALWRVLRASIAGNGYALIVLASLSGFVVIAMFGSLLDAPRIALLVYLLFAVACSFPARASRSLHTMGHASSASDER